MKKPNLKKITREITDSEWEIILRVRANANSESEMVVIPKSCYELLEQLERSNRETQQIVSYLKSQCKPME